jgi:predicted nucleic acid-binding protein
MGFVFLDTSAFIKLYLIEKGSTWIRNFITNNQVIISELTLAESTNTLIRLFRDGILSGTDVSNILATINIHNAKYVNIPLEIKNQLGMLTTLGYGIPANLRLRTLDALQLVGAEIAKTRILAQDPTVQFTFVSSDIKLLQVAQARGFTTENPENYP